MTEASERLVDPVTVLPVEMFQSIVSTFPKNIVLRLRLVSKSWTSRIQGASVLWNSLTWGTLPSYLPQISEQGVKVLLNLARSRSGSIDLFRLTIGGSHEKVNIVSDLIFSRIDSLQTLVLKSHRDGVHIIEHVKPLRHLTSLSIRYDPKDRWRNQADVAEILNTLRSLKQALFDGFRWSSDHGFVWPQDLINLESLSMRTYTCPRNMNFGIACDLPFDHHRLPSLASGAPILKILRLTYTCTPEPNQKAQDLDFSSFKNLEDLAVEQVLPTLVPRLLPSSLKRLRWGTRGMYQAHERLEAAYNDIPLLPQLEILQVGTCPAEQFWYDLVRKSGCTLRSLNLWRIGYKRSDDDAEATIPGKDWEKHLLVDLLTCNLLAGLEWLAVRSYPVDDWLASKIAKHCPSLTCLVINVNHGFSRQAAECLVKKPGQPLRHLVLGSLYYPVAHNHERPASLDVLKKIDFPLRISWACDRGTDWASKGY